MGASVGLFELLTIAVVPFIFSDIIKAIIAAGIASGITPKIAYGKEIDS